MALQTAKQLLRKDVKFRISNLSQEEKLRQSKVVTDKVGMNVNNTIMLVAIYRWVPSENSDAPTVHLYRAGTVLHYPAGLFCSKPCLSAKYWNRL